MNSQFNTNEIGGMPTLNESAPSVLETASNFEEGNGEDPRPILENVDNDSASNVVAATPIKGGIEVMAKREGFFNQHRKKEGDKFRVASISKLGDWMECIDPLLEKKRIKFLSDKKKGVE